MTPPDIQARLLGKVDEEIQNLENIIAHGVDDYIPIGQTDIDEATKHLRFLRALRKVIERHGDKNRNGVCTSCSILAGVAVSFPCPELTEIAKEMGI